MFVQILPELKKRFVLKDIERDFIFEGKIKVKILYKISGMKFRSLELKLSGFAMKIPPILQLFGLLKNYAAQIPWSDFQNFRYAD